MNITPVLVYIIEIIGLIEVALVMFRKSKPLLEEVTKFIERLGDLIKAMKSLF